MSSTYLPDPETEPPQRPTRLSVAAIREGLERSRPDLGAESDEYRAAVILTLLPSLGHNVDRLVVRTGYPRPFVAQCLRRLFDNSWWIEVGGQAAWCEDPLTCRSFWLDVGVALGQQLRRVGPTGSPEWAPVGSWVKDFEYRNARTGEGSAFNEYREIARYDPEPVPAGEEDEELEVEEAVAATLPGEASTRERPEVVQEGLVPSASPAVWLGTDDSSGVGRPARPPSTPGLLVDDWAGANWLG